MTAVEPDPTYPGEPVEIRASNAKAPNGGALNNTNATARTSVFAVNADGTDGAELVADQVMPWDGTGWLYTWATVGRTAGRYRALIKVTPNAGGAPSERYLDIVLEARPTALLIPFGATVADVKALLPHRRWTPDSKPTVDDVERFLVSHASVLNVRLDPPPADPDKAARLTRLARRAIVLGAAAQADAAAGPERARPNSPSSYAEWLQARYSEAVDAAEAYFVELTGEGDIPAGGDPDADPAWAFPDPANWALRGI